MRAGATPALQTLEANTFPETQFPLLKMRMAMPSFLSESFRELGI